MFEDLLSSCLYSFINFFIACVGVGVGVRACVCVCLVSLLSADVKAEFCSVCGNNVLEDEPRGNPGEHKRRNTACRP